MPPQDPLHANSEADKADTRQTSLSFRLDQEHDESDCGPDADDASSSALYPQHRPPGELERLESHRGLRESQRHILRDRRKSFIVQFSQLRGPPQIALLMALLAIGFGSTIGVVPAVMADRFARLKHGYQGSTHCSSYAIEDKPEACFLGGSDAQTAASLANLINNSLTFLTASLTGSISDEYGRKAPLLVGLTLSLVSSMCLYLLQIMPTMNPWWYYSTSASNGLVSWLAVALSAINDVLPQEFRAPGIGLLLAGFLFGLCLSPTLALVLERTTLTLVSFLVVCVGFLLTIFVVPETLPPQVGEASRKRREDREARENERDRQKVEELREWSGGQRDDALPNCCSSGGFWRFYYGSSVSRTLRRLVTRPFWEMSILNRNYFFRMLAAISFFSGMVTSGDQVLLIYYLEDQLAFDAKDVSIMFLTIGVTGIFVQVVVMKPLNDLVGEKMVVAISFLVGTIVNFLYGIARLKSTIFVALAIAGFSQMAFPTISAIKANNVEETEQGRIQGALYSIKALASGVGPGLMQVVYSKTKSNDGIWWGPGSMFLFAGALYIIGIGLALALPNDKANSNPLHGGRPTEGVSHTAEGGPLEIDDEALGEYRRLAASESSSDEEEDYGSI